MRIFTEGHAKLWASWYWLVNNRVRGWLPRFRIARVRAFVARRPPNCGGYGGKNALLDSWGPGASDTVLMANMPLPFDSRLVPDEDIVARCAMILSILGLIICALAAYGVWRLIRKLD